MAPGNLIYILAPSFSGSTLLTFLLDRHPRIHTFGELKATAMGPVEAYHCSCGSLIGDCAYWRSLRERCAALGFDLRLDDFGTHFTATHPLWARVLGAQVRGPAFELCRRLLLDHLPGLRARYQGTLERNARVIAAVLGDRRNDWFLDGSKDPSRLMYFQRSGRWRIRVIRMFRDGRAQCLSHCRKTPGRPDFRSAVRDWRSTIAQMERVASAFAPGDVVSLKYEDLCRDPGGTMTRLWRFLELDAPAIDWSGRVSKEGSHILGNDNMRQSPDVTIRLDERWREELGDAQRREFESLAGAVNRGLGYV
jgi:hypothetical protein